jgi:3-phosphoshikimate 1-carboxyvinyltransferase
MDVTSVRSRAPRVRVPGDKSVSHRAALLAAVASGTSHVTGFSTAGDCEATLRALTSMDVTFGHSEGLLIIHGKGDAGLNAPRMPLDCSRSGTTIRLAAGLLAASKGRSVLTGHPQLLARPMTRVAVPLRSMGAGVDLTPRGTAPITITGADLTAITYELPVASAQVKSAILLAGLRARGVTRVIEPAPSRDHTERLMDAMGARVERVIGPCGIETAVHPGQLGAMEIVVPGDLSSAAALVAGALLKGSELIVESVGLNPTRQGFLRVLMRMGARFQIDVLQESPEPMGDLRVLPLSTRLTATEVQTPEVPSLIDELPLIAVLATQAEGTTVVQGAGELRVKESDRLSGTVEGLRALGANIQLLNDGFVVTGPTPIKAGSCNAYGDHRLAMAFSVACLIAEGDVAIRDANRVGDSFPEFGSSLAAIA